MSAWLIVGAYPLVGFTLGLVAARWMEERDESAYELVALVTFIWPLVLLGMAIYGGCLALKGVIDAAIKPRPRRLTSAEHVALKVAELERELGMGDER